MAEFIAITIAEAARRSSIGRSSLYEAIKRKELPMRKCGRRSLVLVEDLNSWIASLPSTTEAKNDR